MCDNLYFRASPSDVFSLKQLNSYGRIYAPNFLTSFVIANSLTAIDAHERQFFDKKLLGDW